MKYVVISVAMLLTFTSKVFSQNGTESQKTFFLSGGLYLTGVFDGPNQLNMSGYYQNNLHLLSTHVNLGNGKNTNDNGYEEYSLMYGRMFISDWILCSVSGGLTYYHGEWENGDDVDDYTGIGPSLEGLILIAPIKWIGVGLKVNKTFRKHASEFSPLISLQIGKIR